jgi:hypothetical protein
MAAPYYVQAANGTTSGISQHAIAGIWNPSATKSISLLEIQLVASGTPAAGAGFVTMRSTSRATGAGATGARMATGGLQQHGSNESVSQSGFVVDTGPFVTQPTLNTGRLAPCWILAAVAASGVLIPIPRGIVIKPNSGLYLVTSSGVAFPACEVGFVVEEI